MKGSSTKNARVSALTRKPVPEPSLGPATEEAPEGTAEQPSPTWGTLQPEFTAAYTMTTHGVHRGCKLAEVVDVLAEVSATLTEEGAVFHAQRMAMAQAATLDSLFHRLTAFAFSNQTTPHFPGLLKLAFRAQGQCSRTLETLATLRNPVIVARQVNIGQQQVVANGCRHAVGPDHDAEAPSAAISEAPALNEAASANSSFGHILFSPACA